MYVGNNKYDIKLSKTIYEEEIVNILLFNKDNIQTINNFILPNLLTNKKFIYVDYEKNIYNKDFGKNVKVLDFNNYINYNYNPFFNITSQSDVDDFINFILTNFKLKTNISKELFTKGIVSFLKAIFLYDYIYNEKISIENIYNIVKNTKSKTIQSNIDKMFEEKINTSIVFNESLKEYFKFKVLPVKIQNEVLLQSYEIINTLRILDSNKINNIDIEQFLDSDESLILIPDNKSNIKLFELFIYQLYKKDKKRLETKKSLYYTSYPKIKETFEEYLENSDDKKIHIIYNPRNYIHNKILINIISSLHYKITNTIILDNIESGYLLFGKNFINYINTIDRILLEKSNDNNTFNYFTLKFNINNNYLNYTKDETFIIKINKSETYINTDINEIEYIVDKIIPRITLNQLNENKLLDIQNNLKNVLSSKRKRNLNVDNWNFRKEKE